MLDFFSKDLRPTVNQIYCRFSLTSDKVKLLECDEYQAPLMVCSPH